MKRLHFLGDVLDPCPEWLNQLDSDVVVYYMPDTSGWGETIAEAPTSRWLPQAEPVDRLFGILGEGTWSVVETVTLEDGSAEFVD